KELTIGRFGTKNVASIGDPVDNYVTRALNRTLSAEMSRAFRGYINEWELERERGGLIGGEGDVVLGLGSQVTSKLQLRYRQRVPGVPGISHSGAGSSLISPFERNIEAEYRLSRFVYLTTEYTQPRNLNNTPGQTITSQFNVNLKARWEY